MNVVEALMDIVGPETAEISGLVEELDRVFEALPLHNPRPEVFPEPLRTNVAHRYTNDELGDVLLVYSSWAQFWSLDAAMLNVAYRLAKTRLDQEITRQRSSLRDQIEEARAQGIKPPMAKGDVDDEVKNSEVVRAKQDEVMALAALKEAAEAQQHVYDKYVSAVSRVIEVRKMEFESAAKEGRATVRRASRTKSSSSITRGSKGG